MSATIPPDARQPAAPDRLPPQARPRRALASAAAGNMLEWYDWSVFGFLIIHISRHFFPDGASLLLGFAVFGAGFLMRPLGALAFGWIGDTRGRKTALTCSFLAMAAGTAPIAFLPGYADIGPWAPLLLVACRLLQGFSAGGELGGSLAFLAEWAPARRRGFYLSFQQASTHAGALLGSGTVALLSAMLEPEQMAEWGWRLPFLFGALLLPAALWLRLHAGETPRFLAQQDAAPPRPRLPGAAGLGRALALIAAPVACHYIFFTFLASFAQRHGLSEGASMGANTAALALVAICTPLMGMLSDRVGRRPPLVLASLSLLLAAGPAFAWTAQAPGVAGVLAIQAALALAAAMLHGAGPAAVTELFPTRGRALSVALAYGLGVPLAGGFAPFMAAWLVTLTGWPAAPAFYVAAACLLTAWAALRMPETAHRELA